MADKWRFDPNQDYRTYDDDGPKSNFQRFKNRNNKGKKGKRSSFTNEDEFERDRNRGRHRS